jgi:hypothetical protein
MNLTISAPSVNLSISMLFRTLHILSMLTGPDVLLSICLSKVRRLFPSFVVQFQVSDQYVTTGLIIFIYATGYLYILQKLSRVIWVTHFVQWLRSAVPMRHIQAVFSAPVDLRKGTDLISKMLFSLSNRRRWEKSRNIIIRSTTVRNLDKWTMRCLQNVDYKQIFLNFIPAALILRPIVFLRNWA